MVDNVARKGHNLCTQTKQRLKTMNNDKLAVNKRTALMMFWNAGHNTESKLKAANDKLESINQPTKGYWYAEDVSKAIK